MGDHNWAMEQKPQVIKPLTNAEQDILSKHFKEKGWGSDLFLNGTRSDSTWGTAGQTCGYDRFNKRCEGTGVPKAPVDWTGGANNYLPNPIDGKDYFGDRLRTGCALELEELNK